MSNEFRGIRPEDMTKLQQISEMMSRGSDLYARKIADSIDEPVARKLADILVKRASHPERSYENFAAELTETTAALARKVELAVA